MNSSVRIVYGIAVAVVLLTACGRSAVPPTRSTTTTTTVSCPDGKTLQSDGMCR
jgi:hypothetical protein